MFLKRALPSYIAEFWHRLEDGGVVVVGIVVDARDSRVGVGSDLFLLKAF